jgi:hypothetical protein
MFPHFVQLTCLSTTQREAICHPERDVFHPGVGHEWDERFEQNHNISFGSREEDDVTFLQKGADAVSLYAMIQRFANEKHFTVRVHCRAANVKINGKPVDEGRYELYSGDEISVLGTLFLFQTMTVGDPDYPTPQEESRRRCDRELAAASASRKRARKGGDGGHND